MNNERLHTTEKEIVRGATRVLSNLTGSRVKEISFPKSKDEGEVAYIKIELRGVVHKFKIEIKGELRQMQGPQIIEKFGNNSDDWILIARYIPQPLKDYFRSNGINYLELAGNCYINAKGIFIYVADQKVTPIRETATSRLWKPAGLKFLLAIISKPELINSPYREIAKAADVALGNIGGLLEELREEGYIGENEGELMKKEKLISRWAELYHAVLRPKVLIGRFKFLRLDQSSEWQTLKTSGISWGGEPGAALLTGYLRPQNFTIYSEKSANELLKQLKIVPDKDGNIMILEKFWGEMKDVKAGAAPALIVYADLINDLDSRNQETAEKVKKMYLK